MATKALLPFFTVPLAFFLISHICCWFHIVIGSSTPSAIQQNSRQTLEIIIGGGGSTPPANPPDYGECPDCPQPPLPECLPPPPPPPPPPPLPPKRQPPTSPKPSLDPELRRAIQVIERFRKRIKNDPFNITRTWTGDICFDKSKYKGFICDKIDNKFRVVGVKFNLFNFSAGPGCPLPIQDFISKDFKDLVLFHVNSNNFTGGVPFEISKIQKFFEFDLSNNKYTGPFPNSVLGATNLTYLDLRFNQFTGPIHPQVFTLNLDVLFLNNNAFSGTIPENLGQTPVLFLTLANNELTGPIPKSIGQTSRNLQEILLLNNRLSGCLPYEIGFLNQTTVFDASINTLTGPIPNSFGCLEEMQIMNLSFNHFYGAVPESLCSLDDLEELDLKFNFFTQVGVACRKLIENGVLDVSMNCILDLPSQRSASECEAFFSTRRTCPDAKSLNHVPCNINLLSAPQRQQETSHRVRKKAMARSPAYQALNNKHN